MTTSKFIVRGNAAVSKVWRGVGVGAVMLLLGACGSDGGMPPLADGGDGGGGGGGGGNAPTVLSINDLIDSTAVLTLSTAASVTAGLDVSEGSLDFKTEGPNMDAEITVSDDGDTLRLVVMQTLDNGRLVALDVTFTAADVTFDGLDFTEAEKTLGNGDDAALTVLNPGEDGFGPGTSLDYVTYGEWDLAIGGEASNGDAFAGFIVVGSETPDDQMPTTGTADYRAHIDGFLIDQGEIFELAGEGMFTANFGTSSVSGDFTNLTKTNDDTGIESAFAGFTHDGSILEGTSIFVGNTVSPDGTLTGDVEGRFFGPAAVEVGAAWDLTNGVLNLENGINAFGVFVGAEQ